MLLRCYCDESFDGNPPGNRTGERHEPTTYTVAGFLGGEATWKEIARRWSGINEKRDVSRFHASHLNGGTHEYQEWSKNQRIRYSQRLLKVLKQQRSGLHGVAVGMYSDVYRKIISAEGQIKFGHPYLACFKTVVATIAKQMDDVFSPEYKFEMVVDQSPLEGEAIAAFEAMRDDPKFEYRSRLVSCSSGDSQDVVPLQVADFWAYESFKMLQAKRLGRDGLRRGLKSLLRTTGFHAEVLGEDTFLREKERIESAVCGPNGLVIIPAQRPG